MLIAIDLDEVLADTLAAFIAFHNEMYETTFAKEHFHSQHYWEITGETQNEFTTKFDPFIETNYFQNIDPIENAIDVVSSLAKNQPLKGSCQKE